MLSLILELLIYYFFRLYDGEIVIAASPEKTFNGSSKEFMVVTCDAQENKMLGGNDVRIFYEM